MEYQYAPMEYDEMGYEDSGMVRATYPHTDILLSPLARMDCSLARILPPPPVSVSHPHSQGFSVQGSMRPWRGATRGRGGEQSRRARLGGFTRAARLFSVTRVPWRLCPNERCR